MYSHVIGISTNQKRPNTLYNATLEIEILPIKYTVMLPRVFSSMLKWRHREVNHSPKVSAQFKIPI